MRVQRVIAAAMTTFVAAAATVVLPLPAGASSSTSRAAKVACGRPARGQRSCRAAVVTENGGRYRPTLSPQSVTNGGYSPRQIEEAYGLLGSLNHGSDQTVAVIDAYDDPNAESDLGVYRSQWGLTTCTSVNGCFSKVDEYGAPVNGQVPLASSNPNCNPNVDPSCGWGTETSLDLDAVSASCPLCHILLVEGDDTFDSSLAQAVATAERLGAREVSLSFGGGEAPGDGTFWNGVLDKPGVAILAASGDNGYLGETGFLPDGSSFNSASYPAASPYVVAVGGTSLNQSSGSARGWSETVWDNGTQGTGSGCSHYEPQPSWQTAIPAGCTKRMVADVSADADPNTGLAVYDTWDSASWNLVGGTSLSTPLVAGMVGLAGGYDSSVYGAQPLYTHRSLTGVVNDVTTGTNVTSVSCSGSPAFFCTGQAGYDGPTGWGTPAAAPPATVSTPPDPVATPQQLTFATGTINSADPSQTVTFTNSGGAPLPVSNVTVSGSNSGDYGASTSTCTPANSSSFCTVNVSWTPHAPGASTATLVLSTLIEGTVTVPLQGWQDGAWPQVFVDAIAQGNPRPNLGEQLDFGVQPISQTAQLGLHLFNPGTSFAHITVQPLGAGTPFSVGTGTCQGFTLYQTGAGSGESCSMTVSFTPTNLGHASTGLVINWTSGASPTVYGETYTITGDGGWMTVTNQQQKLVNSDGTTWLSVAPNLVFTVTPNSSGLLEITANADLWTWQSGYNQDLGICVTNPGASANACRGMAANTGTQSAMNGIVAWKESGGYAGTFSPNAAYLDTMISAAGGTQYTVSLMWKTNRPGGTISAGAGTPPNNSPTRLSARLLSATTSSDGAEMTTSTAQPSLQNSDGTTWQAVPTLSSLALTPTANVEAVITADADLWTRNPGYNQDIGICLLGGTYTGNGPNGCAVIAWKESGGFAGTFSPNAAFVQGRPVLAPGTYTATLVWKTNKAEPGGVKISIGAGPIPAGSQGFSPTVLTSHWVAAPPSPQFSSSSAQFQLQDGGSVVWYPAGNVAGHDFTLPSITLTPSQNCTGLVTGNSDLWTNANGYNQDIALLVKAGVGPQAVLGWKESGGYAGTFSPNAATLAASVHMQTGVTYTLALVWRPNKDASGAVIAAGAGPSSPYSPTSLSIELSDCS